MPRTREFDLDGMADYPRGRLEEAQRISIEEWHRELLLQEELFVKLYARMPKELVFQRALLTARL
jgi:phosphoenolpyruvate carboxykinase (GTP)